MNVLVENSSLQDIADSIRAKLGVQTTYKPGEMADAIDSISGGGIVPTGTKTITANGTGIDVAQYASADVAVPNSYAAGDEGKVVSNGVLVAQTAHATVTENGTIDTTLNSSVTVNVSGGTNPNHLETGVDICITRGAVEWQSNTPVLNVNSSSNTTAFNNRMSIVSLSGDLSVYYYYSSAVKELSPFHFIPVPSGASTIKMTIDRSIQYAMSGFTVSGGSITGSTSLTGGWQDISANTPVTVSISSGVGYIGIAFRSGSSNAAWTYSTFPNMAKLDFE